MVSAVFVVLGIAFVLGLIGTAVLIRIGRGIGTMDSPGAPGKILRDVPNIGGIAIAWPVIGGIGFVGLAALSGGSGLLVDMLPELDQWADRITDTAPTAVALAAGLLIMHLMGLLDDRRHLSPVLRLVVQIVIAAVLATFFEVRLLRQLDTFLGIGQAPSIVLTTIWIVVITNAMNFLDNMDGLTAGVAVIAGGLLMATALMSHQWFVAGTLAVLVGSTAGFLVFNFPPARIFMGDGGSLVIGMTLAVLVARITYWSPDATHQTLGSGWYGVLMPLAALSIPLYDFSSVMVLRLRQGKNPFQGDTQHFSHRLVEVGLSRRRAVIVIWSLAGVTGAIGLLLGHLGPWLAALAGMQIVLVLVILALLESGARR